MDYRKNLYDRYVSTYKKDQVKLQERWLISYWQWVQYKYWHLLSGVNPEDTILEVGCGAGYFLEFLVNKGFKNVCGLDISMEQAELAKQRGLNVQCADIFEFLKDKKEEYHVIVGIDFLEHFTKDELVKLMQLFNDALKKGGKIILQTPNGQGLFPGQVIYGDMTHATIFTPESLMQLLKLYGFCNFKFYETGPSARNISGYIRIFLWNRIRQLANLIKIIETGKTQSIWTENMICICIKK